MPIYRGVETTGRLFTPESEKQLEHKLTVSAIDNHPVVPSLKLLNAERPGRTTPSANDNGKDQRCRPCRGSLETDTGNDELRMDFQAWAESPALSPVEEMAPLGRATLGDGRHRCCSVGYS